MKKNTMMRVASALLVAVLLTTCAISGTFAKYVTSDNASASARVAKFGVVVSAEVDPFLPEYAAKVAVNDVNGDPIVNSVVAYNGTDLLVAPGTSGDLGATTISGTPEVAVNVKKEATLTLTNWTNDNGDYYCPLIITVNGIEYDGTTYADAAAFIAAVEGAIECDKNYQANTVLDNTDDVEITWEWGFDTTTDHAVNQNDKFDTDLGDKAAAGNAATIALELITTVTQID